MNYRRLPRDFNPNKECIMKDQMSVKSFIAVIIVLLCLLTAWIVWNYTNAVKPLEHWESVYGRLREVPGAFIELEDTTGQRYLFLRN